jgi:hypothetical protein
MKAIQRDEGIGGKGGGSMKAEKSKTKGRSDRRSLLESSAFDETTG